MRKVGDVPQGLQSGNRQQMVGRLARLALVIAVMAALLGLGGGAYAGQAEKHVALVTGNNDDLNSPQAAEAERRIGAQRPDPMAVAQLDDAVAWDHAKNANSIPELQAFKHFFPNSAHVGEADKLIAALQNAADEETRRKAEVEKAKQAEEACRQEAADVADFAKARNEAALTASRAQALCPKTIATIDEALRDIRKQECVSEREQVRDVGSDLEALRKALGGFTCDAVIAATRSRISQLEQQAALVAKACDDAKYEIDNKVDAFEAGARAKLESYLTQTGCPEALNDAQQKIREIDERVSTAQEQLKEFGCYKAEPSSLRFDKETQDAVGRFQRWARLDVDTTHMTADFMQQLAAFTVEGECPGSAAPPPVASIPHEAPSQKLAPPPEQPRPVRPKRPEAVEKAERAPLYRPAPAPRLAPAPRAEPAPQAPAPASSAAKPQIFIPN